MEKKTIDIGLIKEYDNHYANIIEEEKSLGRRQINRLIAKKMKLPYPMVLEIAEESDNIFNELNKEV